MMTSALMGYSDEWQSEKKVPHVEILIHLQKQTQVFMSQLETVNLIEYTCRCTLSE